MREGRRDRRRVFGYSSDRGMAVKVGQQVWRTRSSVARHRRVRGVRARGRRACDGLLVRVDASPRRILRSGPSGRRVPLGARGGEDAVIEQSHRSLGPVAAMPLDLAEDLVQRACPARRTGRSPSRRACGPCSRGNGPGSARRRGPGRASGSRRGTRPTLGAVPGLPT